MKTRSLSLDASPRLADGKLHLESTSHEAEWKPEVRSQCTFPFAESRTQERASFVDRSPCCLLPPERSEQNGERGKFQRHKVESTTDTHHEK